jgi:hypothetical protein
LGRKVQGLHPRRRAGAPWRVAAGRRRRAGRRELGSLKPVRAAGGAPPTMANGSTTPGDRVTDRWAPHVSDFKISRNSEIDHSCGKNSQARRKNLETFVEVGNPIWSNFCY